MTWKRVDYTARVVLFVVQWVVILALAWLALATYVFPASAADTWMREHRDLVQQYRCGQHVPAKHVAGYLVEVTAKGHTIVWHVNKGTLHEMVPIPGRTLVVRAECRR